MFQKNLIFLKFQRFKKVFWNPPCYQHLWCLYYHYYLKLLGQPPVFLRVEVGLLAQGQLLNTAHMPDVPSQVKVNLATTSWEHFSASSSHHWATWTFRLDFLGFIQSKPLCCKSFPILNIFHSAVFRQHQNQWKRVCNISTAISLGVT